MLHLDRIAPLIFQFQLGRVGWSCHGEQGPIKPLEILIRRNALICHGIPHDLEHIIINKHISSLFYMANTSTLAKIFTPVSYIVISLHEFAE